MFESVDRMLMAGLGALSMTRERAENLFDEYVQRGQLEKERREGFVKEMLDTAEKTRQDLEKIIAKQVHETIVKLDVPTREDLERIEAKLDELLQKQPTAGQES